MIYRHGGKSRGSQCSGSGHLPLAGPSLSANHQPDGGAIASQDPEGPAYPMRIRGLPQPQVGPHGCPSNCTLEDLAFISEGVHYRLMEHIPRSARTSCSTLLASLLDQILVAPHDTATWAALFSFGPAVLGKPNRGGRRNNVTSLIKKRVAEFKGASSIPPQAAGRCKPRSSIELLSSAVSSKIEQGNLKAAVRMVCSDEAPAPPTAETADKLRAKHPLACAGRRPFPPKLGTSLCVPQSAVLQAIKSFPNGSSGGLDSLRPQHIKDMVCGPEACDQLIVSITGFVNLLLEGTCPVRVQRILFGGSLIALSKKDGGVRPIAVGSVWRRLASKCANKFASEKLESLLSPIQLGVGVKGGAEAAIHAAGRYLDSLQRGTFLIKLDFSNAFNSLRRDAMLEAVYREVPEIFNFCHLSYVENSTLFFGDYRISSEEGPQQGDPLGPLLFALTIHPILQSLESEFRTGYLDDVAAGGNAATLSSDFVMLKDRAAEMGLQLNISKCELVSTEGDSVPPIFAAFRRVLPTECELLGAPLLRGDALDAAIAARCADLARASTRLRSLSAHDALLILTHSLSAPRVMYILRCSPCSEHKGLDEFDRILRVSLSAVANVEIDDLAWIQASLPIGEGGLGIRSVAMLAPSAFLASAAATLELQTQLLPRGMVYPDHGRDGALATWASRLASSSPPEGVAQTKQKSWDKASVALGQGILWDNLTDPYNRARILASRAVHSGDWLHAWPITACGLRLDDDAIRVAVGYRLGVNICAPHTCPCGAPVDARGSHGLSCRRSAGRQARHAQINDIIHRALVRAGMPSTKEPVGLMRSGDRRPDGCTLVNWDRGRCLAWDATVPDTVAQSHLAETSAVAGAAAERAAKLKNDKYQELTRGFEFCAVAIETMGPINEEGERFLAKLGGLLAKKTGEPRETAFLFQRLAITVQRCNAVSFAGSFENFWPTRLKSEHTNSF